MGLNLSWIGIPNYAFGAITIANLEKTGLDFAYLPIPSISNSSVILSMGIKKKIIDKDEKNNFYEKIFSNFSFSVDHRFFDGAYGAKVNSRFVELMTEVDEKLLL